MTCLHPVASIQYNSCIRVPVLPGIGSGYHWLTLHLYTIYTTVLEYCSILHHPEYHILDTSKYMLHAAVTSGHTMIWVSVRWAWCRLQQL